MVHISSHCLVILSLILVLNIWGTASDSACHARGGTCQDDRIPYTCPGGYKSYLCNGRSYRRCCLPHRNGPGDGKCILRKGLCQNDYLPCRGGGYWSGLCDGDRNRRCCIRYFWK